MNRIYTGTLLILLCTSQMLFSQTLLKGIVMEKQGDKEIPLPFSNVFIEGTTLGTTTNFDGEFELAVQAGTYRLSFSFIGYQKVTKEVNASGEGEMTFNVTLSAGGEQLQEIKVEAKINRESETMLMLEQKKAAVAVESIGARQLSVLGVSDAAGAATKITGITKQEGAKTLNVRGLGDRYNTTTLNGLPFPSNNAETKNIDLELFSSDIIGFISVDKVATAKHSGDFAGANVDIGSKKFVGDPFIAVGVKTGANTSAFGLDNFKLQDGYGVYGFDNLQPPTTLKRYAFETGWNPESRTVAPNMGLSLVGGKSFIVGSGKLNSFITLSHENDYSYSDYLERRINGSGRLRKELKGDKFNFETQTTGLLNFNFDGDNAQYYFNSMFLNSSDQMLRQVNGFITDLAEDGAYISRGEYERTMVFVNQILGEHDLNKKDRLDWGVSYNRVLNVVPDRRHLTFNGYNASNDSAYFTDDNESDYFRYFHQFVEQEAAANIRWDHVFGEKTGDSEYRGKLTLGYSGKGKLRDFESTQFNHDIYQGRDVITDPDYLVWADVNNVDAFLNDQNISYRNNGGQLEKEGEFFLKTFFGKTIRPSTYKGRLVSNATFGSFEYNVNERLLALAGLRYEYIYQGVSFETALKPDGGSNSFSESLILPSLSLRYKLNEKSNLRFSASKTYVLPMFTEMALFQFEGISETTVGNPYLYLSDIYNGDIKWEHFPHPGESFTIAGFGKYIMNPMNKFVMTSASNDFSFANTGDWAYIYGVELEVKKNLFSVSTQSGRRRLFTSANVTLMKTLQELDGLKVAKESKNEDGQSQVSASFNTKTEELQGAAPIIANAMLGYQQSWGNEKSISSSLVYAYVSDRLYLIGTSTFGNQYSKSINSLDFIFNANIKRWGFSLSAKNLLNPSIERVQKNKLERNNNYDGTNETQEFLSNEYIVQTYKNGIKLSVGITYRIN